MKERTFIAMGDETTFIAWDEKKMKSAKSLALILCVAGIIFAVLGILFIFVFPLQLFLFLIALVFIGIRMKIKRNINQQKLWNSLADSYDEMMEELKKSEMNTKVD